ncbi:MAG TPA: hypothetical protein VJZ03_08000 [Candidatus Bathyarchaeia archaeon]|nr:hypothetical protein [Candidatus Bathyarchaeia archaeon]
MSKRTYFTCKFCKEPNYTTNREFLDDIPKHLEEYHPLEWESVKSKGESAIYRCRAKKTEEVQSR